MSAKNGVLVFIGLVNILLLELVDVGEAQSIDYGEALTKSLLFFEAQRSGKLPSDQRVTWRGDSGLKDGSDVGVDLAGGYHDAGDNVKLGFPMAFTVTMLAWSALEFQSQMKDKGELDNALNAVKWGTDYFIKAHNPNAQELYGVVGDVEADHACWERPEDMTTPRTTCKIDPQNPGSDLAGETSAALAAASILFRPTDPNYADVLLTHSGSLFEFARDHPGLYQNSISSANKYYPSTGFQDELLWAAAWLHRATNDSTYLGYLVEAGGTKTAFAFSWDDKNVGAQILVAKLVLEGKVGGQVWSEYKSQAEGFLCSCLQKNSGSNMALTPGGMLWFMPWANLQYVASASFAAVVYGDYLAAQSASLTCPEGAANPDDLISFAKSQVDYILGSNPSGMSYMVGIGSKYPTQAHHRGASIVSIKTDPTPVGCQEGYDVWYNKDSPNPNVLDGAVVGGPDQNDAYIDSRSNYQQAEPATATSAPLVGVLARLSST